MGKASRGLQLPFYPCLICYYKETRGISQTVKREIENLLLLSCWLLMQVCRTIQIQWPRMSMINSQGENKTLQHCKFSKVACNIISSKRHSRIRSPITLTGIVNITPYIFYSLFRERLEINGIRLLSVHAQV